MSRKTIGICAVMAVMTAGIVGFGGSVLASHTFNDTAGTPFETEIDNVVHAGCATGFPSGNFQPTAAFSRQGFAGWFNRCGGRVAIDGPSDTGPLSDGDAMANVSIDVGGVGNDVTQMVLLTGNTSFWTNSAQATYSTGGFRNAGIRIWDTDTNTDLTGSTCCGAFARMNGDQPGATVTLSVAVEATKGTHNYELRFDSNNLVDGQFRGNTTTLTARVFPFGPEGTNELDPAPGAPAPSRAADSESAAG